MDVDSMTAVATGTRAAVTPTRMGNLNPSEDVLLALAYESVMTTDASVSHEQRETMNSMMSGSLAKEIAHTLLKHC